MEGDESVLDNVANAKLQSRTNIVNKLIAASQDKKTKKLLHRQKNISYKNNIKDKSNCLITQFNLKTV